MSHYTQVTSSTPPEASGRYSSKNTVESLTTNFIRIPPSAFFSGSVLRVGDADKLFEFYAGSWVDDITPDHIWAMLMRTS